MPFAAIGIRRNFRKPKTASVTSEPGGNCTFHGGIFFLNVRNQLRIKTKRETRNVNAGPAKT